jgi:hypothetical protein
MLKTLTEPARELASSTLDSTGCCDISADGSHVAYATKSPNYNVEIIGTNVGAVSSVLNQGGTSERANDPAISATGNYVTYTSLSKSNPRPNPHELRMAGGRGRVEGEDLVLFRLRELNPRTAGM